MKKLVLGAVAALVATVALTSGAQAGGFVWHNHGWHNGWHHGFWGGPRIVIRPAFYNDDDYCFVKKVREYDEYGNVYLKRVRVCD
jgi:hypothetical protein